MKMTKKIQLKMISQLKLNSHLSLMSHLKLVYLLKYPSGDSHNFIVSNWFRRITMEIVCFYLIIGWYILNEVIIWLNHSTVEITEFEVKLRN